MKTTHILAIFLWGIFLMLSVRSCMPTRTARTWLRFDDAHGTEQMRPGYRNDPTNEAVIRSTNSWFTSEANSEDSNHKQWIYRRPKPETNESENAVMDYTVNTLRFSNLAPEADSKPLKLFVYLDRSSRTILEISENATNVFLTEIFTGTIQMGTNFITVKQLQKLVTPTNQK